MTYAFVAERSLPGVQVCSLDPIPLGGPTGKLSLKLNDTTMGELWVAVAWAAN